MLRRSSASLALAALLLPSPRLFGDEWLSNLTLQSQCRYAAFSLHFEWPA